MFTLETIHEAHSKVRTGADFPKYVLDLKQLGVLKYVVFVNDGTTTYYGSDDFEISSTAKYAALDVESTLDKETFEQDLLRHQQGKSDYMEFCEDCAKSGIAGWWLDLESNVCVYFDSSDMEVLRESISLD